MEDLVFRGSYGIDAARDSGNVKGNNTGGSSATDRGEQNPKVNNAEGASKS